MPNYTYRDCYIAVHSFKSYAQRMKETKIEEEMLADCDRIKKYIKENSNVK